MKIKNRDFAEELAAKVYHPIRLCKLADKLQITLEELFDML